MQSRDFLLVVGVACLLAVAPPGTAADKDSITVELKAFKFNVKEDKASLFGFN